MPLLHRQHPQGHSKASPRHDNERRRPNRHRGTFRNDLATVKPGDAWAGLVVILDDEDPMGDPLEAMAVKASAAGCGTVRAIRRHLRAMGVCGRNQRLEAAAWHALNRK